MSSLSMRGRLRLGANRRPRVVFPLPGNPEITTKGLRIREVVRTTLFSIDTIDLTYYTVADGDGQTTAARDADINVGGHQRSATESRASVLHTTESDPRGARL